MPNMQFITVKNIRNEKYFQSTGTSTFDCTYVNYCFQLLVCLFLLNYKVVFLIFYLFIETY